MKAAKDFLTIRERILKNSIYNNLLIAALSKSNTCVTSYAIIPVNEKLKPLMKAESKARYLMCKVIAVISPLTFQIGYTYNDSEPIWTHYPKITAKNYTSALKKLAEEIYNTYPVAPSKQDKIFSKHPAGFLDFLQSQNVSPSLWKSGTSRAIKSAKNGVSSHELVKYYNALNFHNNCWAMFNTILIALIKKGGLEVEKKDVGKLTIEKTGFDMRLYFCLTSYIWDSVFSAVVHYEDLNPKGWEKYETQISIFELIKLFT